MNAVLQWGLSLLHKSTVDIGNAAGNPATQPVSLARQLVHQALQRLQGGRLAVFENGKVQVYGQWRHEEDINASITINHADTWQRVMMRGSIGAAEAYMEGSWSSPDLTQVIRLLVRNRDVLRSLDGQQSLAARMALKALHALNRNTPEGARENIHAHYDLSNEFFALFLDPAMMYSSAVFNHPSQPLADAALYKLDLVCQQLQLKPGDHLVEIGSGWGGLAIHAAKHYGCRVTTTTISDEQYAFAQARIAEEGLSEQITLLLKDYRELEGQYDKLVSIEMIEAVGAEFQPLYFETCNRLLKPGGLALIQAITIREDLYKTYLSETDFIRQYIFPGGCLPTIPRIKQVTREQTDLELVAITDISTDYASTLNHWRQRFLFNASNVMALGFGLPFIRMWEYYFSYCEGGFLEGSIGTQQLLFSKARLG